MVVFLYAQCNSYNINTTVVAVYYTHSGIWPLTEWVNKVKGPEKIKNIYLFA